MYDAAALERVCSELIKRHGDRGAAAAEALRLWLSGNIPLADPEWIGRHLLDDHLGLLFDAFWQILPFGTGGRRGPVGYGPNRMNTATVGMTVQGHCDYLRKMYGAQRELTVVVANDVRVFHDIAGRYRFLGASHPLLNASSRSFARLACEVYAGNGITAYFSEPEAADALLSTPMLSYVIGELGAAGGINLSASHNPPDDNGIKVYDAFGSQPVAPDDQRLADTMIGITRIHSMPFDQALRKGLIRPIPAKLTESYVETYVRHFGATYRPAPDDPVIVYSPLCGCGLTTAGAVLERLGFRIRTPPRHLPDGTFADIPLKAPNPEVPQATQTAKAYADEIGSDIVLCSDPDADRVGLEAKLPDGAWYHFDGNQIAAMLAYFLMVDPEGPQRKGLLIETLVTSKILGGIASKAGSSFVVDDLLVGFKYVAHVLKTLQQSGRYGQVACSPDDLVIAAEESHGVSVIPTIRDKDSTPACIYLAALYQMLRRRRQTFLDYYIRIVEQLGEYDCVSRSVMMAGAAGMQRKEQIMRTLRSAHPARLGGTPVKKAVDHWDEREFGPFVSETEKLPRDVLQFFTEAGVITIRPSGTEPKIKVYYQLIPYGARSQARGAALLKEIRAKAETFAAGVVNELLAIIGIRLSAPALRLPDIIDLDCRIAFEQETLPALLRGLEEGRFASLEQDLLPWLREQTRGMTPGADPLPALKSALASACAEWQTALPNSPRLAELSAWTGMAAR